MHYQFAKKNNNIIFLLLFPSARSYVFSLAVLNKFPVPFKYISIHILDTAASIPNHLKMLHQQTTEDNNLLRKCSQDSTSL